jgi:predicted transglutaminase-like cysteine proteinase
VVGENTVRQTIEAIAAMVVIATVTAATATRQNVGAAFDTNPLPPMSHAYAVESASYEYMPYVMSHGATSGLFTASYQPKSYFDPSLFAPFSDLRPLTPLQWPHQSASVGDQKKSIPDRPSHQSQIPIVRIEFNTPALAPMAHTFFCLKYHNDCRIHQIVFRGGALKLTAERWADLKRINAEVNHAIIPTRNNAGLAAEKWAISPKAGDCHDYAVTKRHELLARGWPARSLLLSEVETSWGEHHLVLVVRTNEGDFVADNLNGDIRSWSNTPYQWVRIQSPNNPMFWSTVASTIVSAKVAKLTSAES